MNPPEGGGDRNGATSRRSTHPRDPGPLRPRGDDEPERDDPIAVVNKNWTRHSHVLNVETGTVRGFEGAPLASSKRRPRTRPLEDASQAGQAAPAGERAGWEAALEEIEHQAMHWDTPDHGQTGHLIAEALRAAVYIARAGGLNCEHRPRGNPDWPAQR